MTNARVFILFFAIFLTRPAFAATKLDRDVQAFLGSSPIAAGETARVLLIYEARPSFTPHASRQEIEQAMIRNIRDQELSQFGEARSEVGTLNLRSLWIANGTIASLDRAELRSLIARKELASVHSLQGRAQIIRSGDGGADGAAHAGFTPLETFTYGLEKLNVPALRVKYPQLDGTGIRVAILDTGIDPNHPDLKGRTKAFRDFTGAKSAVVRDDHGHGTHVAGTIAGGSTSGLSIGIAPKAELLIGKVFDSYGQASNEDLLLSMQWAADPDGNPATNDYANVVSNSWNLEDKFDSIAPADNPFCATIANWLTLGMVPVFAAGNDGPDIGTVSLPGSCPEALTIAATDEDDAAASFSSRGPANWKSGTVAKPDISAPGMDVESAQPGGGYRLRSGTSMATPHAAGAMAILLQARPGISVVDAKKVMLSGATQLGASRNDSTFGAGRIDLLKSVDLVLSP
jgi:subtilisin family serine protease